MDINNQQIASASTSKLPLPKYTFKRPYLQRFSLPFPIIKYMIQNPQSGKVWKKLIFTCKYFYSKYPVFPVRCLKIHRDSKGEADGEVFDFSKPFPKLWLYHSLCAIRDSNISCLFSKSFIFDLRDLIIVGQTLTFDDYQALTSSGFFHDLCLWSCSVKNADGTVVTADKLLQNLQHLNKYVMGGLCMSRMFQGDTVKKLIKHFNRFDNLSYLNIFGMDESFDFASFADFLLKNKTVDIRLAYSDPVSAEYKKMVANVIKEVKKNHSLKVPDISYL